MISSPCYATREDVSGVLDVALSARTAPAVDRAIEAASRQVEGLLHRTFYPQLATRHFDWPNYQYAAPWRLWLDQHELADTAGVVVVTGSTVLPPDSAFYLPDTGPPYTRLELDESSTAAFGGGPTPQRDITITGLFGYTAAVRPAAALAVALADGTAATLTVTSGASIGVGDTLLVGTERMLVTGRAMADTGQTQQGAGAGTAFNADVALAVTDGAAYEPGEVLLVDAERMLIIDVAGDTLIVKRAWAGSVLAVHAGATIYASRTLTVARGALGTTAAAHPQGTPVAVGVVPGLVKQLAVGEAVVSLGQQIGGYAAVQGASSGESSSGARARVSGIGAGLVDVRAQAYRAYGRKARQAAV